MQETVQLWMYAHCIHRVDWGTLKKKKNGEFYLEFC